MLEKLKTCEFRKDTLRLTKYVRKSDGSDKPHTRDYYIDVDYCNDATQYQLVDKNSLFVIEFSSTKRGLLNCIANRFVDLEVVRK